MSLPPFHVLAPLAVIPAAVCLAQEAELETVADTEGFNALLAKHALQGKRKFRFRLSEECTLPPNKLMRYSHWYDYATAYRFTKEDSVYTITLAVKDSTRMLVGHRDPEFRKKLNKKERAALGRMEERLKELLTPGMTEGEKVRAIHDDLVNRVTYNVRSGGECTTLLLTDSGLCDAYSRYMFLALGIAGVECHIVLGKAGVPHAWNMAKIDGRWYHIDATWDDPISAIPTLRHDYFCISDRAMARDHSWNTKTYPPAPAVDSAYFKRHGRYFTQYGAFWKAVVAAHTAGEKSFEAKLTPLAKEDRFAQSLADFSKAHPEVRVDYYSHAVTDPTIIYLTFVPKEDSRKKVEPAERRMKRPGDAGMEVSDWLDPDMWKDLCNDFDSDALLEEGRKMLDQAGKKGKEMWDEGAGKLKEWEDAAGSLF